MPPLCRCCRRIRSHRTSGSIPASDNAEKACRDICAAAARLDIPLEYNMAGLTLQGRPDGSLGYTRDEFWRIAAEYPVKAIMGCDAHAPSELDVVHAIEEKKAFLHSLGIPVLDTLPGLE